MSDTRHQLISTGNSGSGKTIPMPKKKEVEERKQAFKCLPPSIKSSLTEEEVEMFLHSDIWSDDLMKKMSEFIVDN